MEKFLLKKPTLNALTNVNEMTSISLELVYSDSKPEGVGSVQSITITDKYFVVAGRPHGTREMGGETNNRLMIIDRKTLVDATKDFKNARGTYELGHANGITYNSKTNELLVVSLRDRDGHFVRMARIDASDFSLKSTEVLPASATGIAYDETNDVYYVRSGSSVRRLNSAFDKVLVEYDISCGLAVQDIGFNDGYIYLTNWANPEHYPEAHTYGIELNQNTIVKVDSHSGEIDDIYFITSPREELESMDFMNGEAYVLMNGQGKHNNNFYIYRVIFP